MQLFSGSGSSTKPIVLEREREEEEDQRLSRARSVGRSVARDAASVQRSFTDERIPRTNKSAEV